MGSFKYSKLKLDKTKLKRPENLSRQTGHHFFDDQILQDSAAFEASSDMSSSMLTEYVNSTVRQ